MKILKHQAEALARAGEEVIVSSRSLQIRVNPAELRKLQHSLEDALNIVKVINGGLK